MGFDNIEEARRAYERYYFDMPYPEVMKRIEAGESLSRIGYTYGRSRESMRQIHNRYFKPFLDTPDPNDRLAERARAKRLSSFLKNNPHIEQIIVSAFNHDLSTELIPTSNKTTYYKNRISINGHICLIARTTKNNHGYTYVSARSNALKKCAYHIVMKLTTGQIFIYPASELLSYYKSNDKTGELTYGIPDKLPGEGNFNHSQYLENWDQLK